MARGFGLTVDVDAVLADLDEVDRVVPRQVQAQVKASAARYETEARAATPIGPPRRGRRPMSTGWQTRQRGPFMFHVVNTRPHAHLVERGFSHVSGRRVNGINTLIPLAQRVREDMVRDLSRLVGPDFQGRLRALEAV